MRKRTVRTGLKFMITSVSLLLLGTFYSQQINMMFSIPADGVFEFVKLAFLWGGISGAVGIIIFTAGLIQRSTAAERFSLVPYFFLLIFLVTIFFGLFYRSITSAPSNKPLRPGETLII